jgi:Fic family protein
MQMRKIFDYSFLKKELLPAGLLNISNAIVELKTLGKIRKENFKEVFQSLEQSAKIISVQASNEIEGIVSSEERIARIVTKNEAPLTHDEAEIAGYRDALNLIHANYAEISITEKQILQLHKIMLSYTNSEGGIYKHNDNLILEIDKSGGRKIRFSPVLARDTPYAMEQMILAFVEAQSDYQISQLLLIPCFILDFLSIHPFADGNGRISRLLSLLLLYKNDFDVGKYISFEGSINKNKNDYYHALKQSSDGWHNNKNSYLPFIENFLHNLLLCYRELDKHFAFTNNKKFSKKSSIE